MPTEGGSFRYSPYGYNDYRDGPTRSHALAFLILFTISTVLHAVQAVWRRTWWLLATIFLCGVLEVIGWAGRLQSSTDVRNVTAYLQQISSLILGPCFLTAMDYILLGLIIKHNGVRYSRLGPKWYGIIFICSDLLAIIVQAIGGGMASVAAQSDDPNADPEVGGHVMLAGIVLQLAAMSVFTILGFEFTLRLVYDWPVSAPASGEPEGDERPLMHADVRTRRKQQALLFMVLFTTLLVFVRSFYRVVELADGWTGTVIRTELYFDALDGFPIVTAMWVANILPPAFLLHRASSKRLSASSEKAVDA